MAEDTTAMPDISAPERLYRALKVVTSDLRLRATIRDFDPKALEQAQRAIDNYEAEAPSHRWTVAEADWCEDDGSRFCTVHNAPYDDDSDVCQDANV